MASLGHILREIHGQIIEKTRDVIPVGVLCKSKQFCNNSK